MLIKFLPHTGADGKDGDASNAIRYLLADVVLKFDGKKDRKHKTTRARPPIPLSGDPVVVRLACESLTTKRRYASGVIAFEKSDIDIEAFEAGDRDIRLLCDDVMQDFEDTAFAGIPVSCRPHVLWVAHIDKGRLELNFLFARAATNASGKTIAINPMPPGKMGRALWAAFRDKWNGKCGWADPLAHERHQTQKLPAIARVQPAVGDPKTPDIREQLALEIADAVESGTVANRTDVIEHFEAKGYKINRTGKDYISVRPHPDHGKPVRLRGDLFDERFTSPEWLVTCGYAALADPRPARRDMSGAATDLAALVEERAKFHRARLKHAIEEPSEAPAPAVNAFDGLICDWAPDGKEKGRLWHRRYGDTVLSPELAGMIDYLDYAQRTVRLRDGSKIVETDTRLAAYDQTEATIRIMVAQVRAKGWSGISVRGDEGFLRDAARLAFAEGIEIAGRDGVMDAIVRDEIDRVIATQLATDPTVVGDVQNASFANDGEMPPPRTKHPFTNAQTRIWESLYGTGSLPDDLGPTLQYVSAKKRWCKLKDGAFVRDSGDRISLNRSSENAFRLIIATARAKGWSGLSINGSPAFLRMATRVAMELDFPITGRTDEMQDIIEDEWDRITPDVEDVEAPESPKPSSIGGPGL